MTTPALYRGREVRARARTPLDAARMRLSVLVPVYNERSTIDLILEQVAATPMAKEVIVVDDASTDGTDEVLQALKARGLITTLFRQPQNRGKGAAIR
jgi:dolichol-phosphate mannosyltransferase